MTSVFGTGPNKGRKRFRQTLLTFSAHTRSNPVSDKPSSVQSSVIDAAKPARAPTLPAEIWHRILEPLGPLALKTMRLVCRDWSVIGVDFLFSTVYLNSYEKSWAGLRSLCNSSYAPCVRRIVWNPLVLSEECLDGPVWRLRYQNLIKGLSQSETFALHREYVSLYSKRRDLLRSSAIGPISEALRNLPHCYECVISDDYDLESTCLDPYMREKVQGLLWDLPGYATWGLQPRWLQDDDDSFKLRSLRGKNKEDGRILRTGAEVFELLRNCTSIKRLSVEFWDENWLRMTEEGRSGPRCSVHGFNIQGVTHSAIQHIALRLKYCKGDWLPFGRYRLPRILEDTFGGMFSFPELRELSIEPMYTDPGPEFMADDNATTEKDTASDSEQNEDGDSDGRSESSRVHYTLSQLEEAYHRPDGLTVDMMRSLNAKLDFGLVKLAKLEKLVLTNVTLDARCLLLWLCEQEQLPLSGLSICLQGITFLFDLDPKTLFQGLTQLNVSLCYAPARTFHYPPSPAALVDEPFRLGNTICHTPTTWSVGLECWSKYDVHDLAWETLPAQMPAFQSSEILPTGPIEFGRRPSAFISIQNGFHHQKPDIELFYYCMPGLEGGICDWLDNTTHRPDSLTLLMYKTYWADWPDPDAGYFSEEFEHVIRNHTDEIDQRAAAELEWQEQQPLLQYEAELLGLDVMNQLDHMNNEDL